MVSLFSYRENNSVAKEDGPCFHRLAPDLQILALFLAQWLVTGCNTS